MSTRPGKTCHRCGWWKPSDHYSSKADPVDGRHPYCKSCRATEWALNKARHTPIDKANKEARQRALMAKRRPLMREVLAKIQAAQRPSNVIPIRQMEAAE